MREYGLYMTIKDFISEYDEKGLRAFVREISDKMKDLLDEGWKESSKKDIFIKSIRQILQNKIWKEYYWK